MTVRFIQVGLGVRGAHWARVIREEPGATIAAFVDLHVDMAAEKATAWGQPDVPCFAQLDSALDAVEADAVLLVTPPAVHRKQALTAFARDCHVLCEKPLAETLDEAVDIVQEAKCHDRYLMVGMNFRYLPVSQAIRRLIQEQTLGVPGFGLFSYLRHRDGRRSDLNDYPLTMKQPMLLEQSIHHLDLMRYCYDGEVKTVSATTWRPSWSTYADDCCVSLVLCFENGLHVIYLGTWTAGWNNFQFQWRTDCAGGVIMQKEQFEELYVVKMEDELARTGPIFKSTEDAEPLEQVPLEPAEPFIDDTRGLLREFVAALEDRQPLVTSGRDHIRTLGLTFAAIEAAETKCEIDVDEYLERQLLKK